MSRFKYYLKKPKSEISKDIVKYLALSGAVCIAGLSPFFILSLLKNYKKYEKYKRKRVYDTFYNLRKGGFLTFEKKNHQMYVALTEAGKKAAGRFQIDDINIKKPKKWDKKWRLVIFDIANLKRTKRELFRGKLKTLGFWPLQKSVWAHPYKCEDEIGLLREFFGLNKDEVCLVTADSIETEALLRKKFGLS